jgi:hypothetical protein
MPPVEKAAVYFALISASYASEVEAVEADSELVELSAGSSTLMS